MVIRNRSLVTLWLALVTLVAALALPTRANTWPPLLSGGRLVGQNTFRVMQDNGGSLETIAKKYNVDFLALLQANPGIDPYVPRAGGVLATPLQTPLPGAPREGLMISLAELCLYYYSSGKNKMTVHLTGIGQLDGTTITPIVVTTVSNRRANLIQTPIANIHARYKAVGIELPTVVPVGPNNPMGHHVIRLAAYGGVYLLHSANADFGIGMRVSSDHIRLRGNDIKVPYNAISPGTKVDIINTLIKVSVEPDDRRLVEVRQPLSKHIGDDPQTLPITPNVIMTGLRQAPQTDGTVMEYAINYCSGMPIDATRHTAPGPQSLQSYIVQNKKPA